jgi:hypothetical protein
MAEAHQRELPEIVREARGIDDPHARGSHVEAKITSSEGNAAKSAA